MLELQSFDKYSWWNGKEWCIWIDTIVSLQLLPCSVLGSIAWLRVYHGIGLLVQWRQQMWTRFLFCNKSGLEPKC